MKKTIKGFILGVIFTTLLMNTVFGVQVKKTIEVIYNSVNLTVNGTKINADNILYEGTTYVPLRAVADALGKDVAWDQATYTASINDKGFNNNTTDSENAKKELTRITNPIIKYENKYLGISSDGQSTPFFQVDDKNNLYSDLLGISSLSNIYNEHFTIQPSSNPNIDGEIKYFYYGDTNLTQNQYKKYSGANTISIIEFKLFNKDKSKYVEVVISNDPNRPNNGRIDKAESSLPGFVYIENGHSTRYDTQKWSDYMKQYYKVYYDEKLNSYVIEILK